MGDELKISQGAATEGAETLSRTKWFADVTQRAQQLEERAQKIQSYREALMSEPGDPSPEALAKLTEYEKELSGDLAELAAERKAMEGGAGAGAGAGTNAGAEAGAGTGAAETGADAGASAGASADASAEEQGAGKGSAKPHRHIANETTWYAVCTSPDLCKVGKSVIPFDSFAIINKRQKASPNVYAQKTPVYRVGDLHHGVLADAGKHVVAGTSLGGGYVKFLTGNDHVLTNGLPTVRHGSECLVNCNSAGVGGAPGMVVTVIEGGGGSSGESAAPEAPEGNETGPNKALQALLDDAADIRSFWQKTKDFGANAWKRSKEIGAAMAEHPGDALIGVGKGILNLPTDTSHLIVMAMKHGTLAGKAANHVADSNNQAALEAYKAGDLAKANELAATAAKIKDFGYVGDLCELTTDAQKGGAIASIFVPVGGVVKAAGGAAKAAKGGKAADALGDAANAARGADAAADAAKGADAGGDAAKATEGAAAKEGVHVKRYPNFVPKQPAHVSKSHSVDTINANTRWGDGNKNQPKSIAMGGVDIKSDIAEINAGQALKMDNGDILTSSGRVYGIHPDKAAVFPKDGPGIVKLTQAEYSVYTRMVESGGLQGEAKVHFDNMFKAGNKGLSETSQQSLETLYNSRSKQP